MRRSVAAFSFLALAVLTAFLVPAGCRKDPEAVWVDRVIAGYGGEKALRSVRSTIYRGEIEAVMRQDHGREVIFFERPGRLRVILEYSRSREDRVLNGDQGWRNSGEGFVEVKGPPLEAMVFQYQHLDLPLGLIDGGYRISLSEEQRNGKRCPVLNLRGAEDPPMAVTIDPDTGLILHVAGMLQVQGGETQLAVDYDDYRSVAGVMLPHRIVNFAGGMPIARTVFDSVEVNKPLTAGTFRPEEIRFEPEK